MLKRCIIILIPLLTGALTNAQTDKYWSLDECIRYAEEHNIDVRRQTLNVDRSELILQESKWAFVPSLVASSNYTESTGRVLDPTTYQFVQTSLTGNSSSSISGNIIIFEGGKKIYALDKAKISLRASVLKDESVRFNLKLNVTAAYMDILCAKEQVLIAEQSAFLVEAQLGRSKALLEAGRITESDFLQIQSQLFAAQNDISAARHSLQMARLSLCSLLEIEDYSTFEVAEPATNSYLYGEVDIEAVIDNHPDYRAIVLEQELSLADLKIAKSSLYPELSLSAGYGSSFSDARRKSIVEPDGTIKYEAYHFFQQYVDNASAYVSVGLKIPILTGFMARNSVKRAKIAVKEAEYEAMTVRKELRKKILQAQIDCETARDKYLRAQEEVIYAERVQLQIDEKYNLGTSDYVAWNAAIVELSKARYSLTEAKFTYYLKNEFLRSLILL